MTVALGLARAIAGDPLLMVLDEPTTGLDVLTQDLVLAELDRQAYRLGCALLVISHDLAVVARLAQYLLVLRGGRIIERGECAPVLRHPEHPFTRLLVESCPDLARSVADSPGSAASVPAPPHPEFRTVLAVAGLSARHESQGPRWPPPRTSASSGPPERGSQPSCT